MLEEIRDGLRLTFKELVEALVDKLTPKHDGTKKKLVGVLHGERDEWVLLAGGMEERLGFGLQEIQAGGRRHRSESRKLVAALRPQEVREGAAVGVAGRVSWHKGGESSEPRRHPVSRRSEARPSGPDISVRLLPDRPTGQSRRSARESSWPSVRWHARTTGNRDAASRVCRMPADW